MSVTHSLISSGELRIMLSRRKNADGTVKPVSYMTLHRWRSQGLLPYKRIGKSIYYFRDAIMLIWGLTEERQFVEGWKMVEIRERLNTFHRLKASGTLTKEKEKAELQRQLEETQRKLRDLQNMP